MSDNNIFGHPFQTGISNGFIQEVGSWGDMLAVLQKLPPEKLSEPIQVVRTHPDCNHVHALCPAVCLGTVDELELKYARSSVNNRRNGSDLVLYVDRNPFAKDGAVAYDMQDGGKMMPIYPIDHADAADWSGPAQQLVDNG